MRTEQEFNQWIAERNDALLSLNETKIRAYAKKYGVKLPNDEKVFWAGIHKARCEMPLDVIPKDEQIESAAWLMENGMFPGIGYAPTMKCSKVNLK